MPAGERESGKVFAVEIIPELKEMGEKNISKFNFIKSGRVKVLCMDASRGLPKEAPFDRIIAAAYADKIPSELKEQLKIGGRLVIPVISSIFLILHYHFVF